MGIISVKIMLKRMRLDKITKEISLEREEVSPKN